MAQDDLDFEAHIESAARILDLPLTDTFRPGILINFRNLAGLYEAVRGVDPPEAPDPLGIYRP